MRTYYSFNGPRIKKPKIRQYKYQICPEEYRYFPNWVITAVIKSVPVFYVVEDFLKPTKRLGRDFEVTCFSCLNKARLSKKKYRYKCYRCGCAAQTSVSFIMQFRNISFLDAVKFLIIRYRIPISIHGTSVMSKRCIVEPDLEYHHPF